MHKEMELEKFLQKENHILLLNIENITSLSNYISEKCVQKVK